MKSLRVSEDIVPLARFKTQASQIFRRLKEGQRPVVVTQNGRPAGVLITPEEFDRLQERDRFITAINRGLADAEAGRLIDDDELDLALESRLAS